MGTNSAEYMRAYRLRRKLKAALEVEHSPDEVLAEARRFTTEYATLANDRLREIEQLQEEVRHLKAELANRPASLTQPMSQAKNDAILRQLKPPSRKAQQASRDAILRKINRGG